MKNLLEEFIPKLKHQKKELKSFMSNNTLSPYAKMNCRTNLTDIEILITISERVYKNITYDLSVRDSRFGKT